MSKTEKNLQTAFAGESQANRKYLSFAQKADAEGYSITAKLFRAAAEAETIHAMHHLKVLGYNKNTQENLKAAITGETYEFTKMYPDFIKEANEEENQEALKAFIQASAAEEVHANLYQKMLDSLSDKAIHNYFVCPVCGFIADNDIPEVCPICGTKHTAFKEIK
jgi:rubrerythrin